jgi:diguanylate cyclase (GGDEF)-like protein
LAFKPPATLQPVIAPAAILLGAALALAVGPELPPSLEGLKVLGPYLVLALACAVAYWFNRGRAFIAAASLLAAYTGWHVSEAFLGGGFAARAVYTGTAVLVPFNVLLALAFPERGVSHHRDYRWLLGVALEILLVAWIAGAGKTEFSGMVWLTVLDHWLLRGPPTPWLARLLFAGAIGAALWRAWPRHAPLDIGIAAALAALFIASEWSRAPGVFVTFVTTAGVVLLVAVLQESHRLAFRDELTALPGRRALMEALAALGPHYVLAMLDVDHFKKFNDTHGHDIGDQVLRLVAARLAETGGGARAYRYGGEEFTVLFPEASLAQALAHLEDTRRGIERYQMAVRSPDRPKDTEEGSKHRGEARIEEAPEKLLSVTVSIGVAVADQKSAPERILKLADEALYRAKKAGRNRVSR